jgi:hypothetical protein
MDTTVPLNNPNTGTFLDSRYLDPGYWFNHFFPGVVQLWNLIFSTQTAAIVKTLLFFLAVFFLTIICYTVVRMFEIRKKEHEFLHHEIEEYAHNKAESEKRLQ